MRCRMKRLVIAAVLLTGCDAVERWTTSKPLPLITITCYSGGKEIGIWSGIDVVVNADGVKFREPGKDLVRHIQADCVVRYEEQ